MIQVRLLSGHLLSALGVVPGFVNAGCTSLAWYVFGSVIFNYVNL